MKRAVTSRNPDRGESEQVLSVNVALLRCINNTDSQSGSFHSAELLMR